MLRRLLGAAAMVLAAAAPLPAQDARSLPPPILTLDQERLFSAEAAVRLSSETERLAAELAAENRRIEAELSAEELELTELRPTLEPEAFRELADAFDAKVEQIRAEQDAKERALQQRREEDRQTFLRQITPILAEIARDRGALVVLDRRAVILSADAIDITEEVVARINAAFEEAPESPTPAPPPEQDAPMPDPESGAPENDN